MSLRPIQRIIKPQQVIDGAGVQLNRVFGHEETSLTDPFLMLDHFAHDGVNGPMAGFPWHPHRGIETITYILKGRVKHEDSLGNSGILGNGDVQWMTAGSGIIHQEMPTKDVNHEVHGFQLWANLPQADKMMDPRYQDIPSGEIPEVVEDDGTMARIITGEFWGKTGPVTGIVTNPRYLDISMPPNTIRTLKVELTHHAFAYIFEGDAFFPGASLPVATPTEYVNSKGMTDTLPSQAVENRNLILFDQGDAVRVRSGDKGVRFLLISGQPLKDPIAWHGPIVMNTREELIQAFEEYQNGTFIKHGKKS